MPDTPEIGGRTIREDFLTLPGGMRLHYGIVDPPGIEPLFTVFTVPGLGELVAKKDFELGAPLAAQRARHIVFDPRGQGQSGRFLDGPARQRAYVPGFATYTNDLDLFYEKIVRRHQIGKLIAYGHSTGGLALLSWLAEKTPGGISGVAVSAPALTLTIPPQNILGLSRLPVPLPVALAIAKFFVLRGNGADYAWGEHDYNPDFGDRRLTHDQSRFDWLGNYFTQHPAETTGGATWNWFYETLLRGLTMRLKGELARVKYPLLVLLAGEDRVVPSRKIARWMRRAPNAEISTIPGAYHELMNETELYRAQALAKFLEFTKRHAQ